MPQKGIINPMQKYPEQISSTLNVPHAFPKPKRSYPIRQEQTHFLHLRARFQNEFDATIVRKHKQMIANTQTQCLQKVDDGLKKQLSLKSKNVPDAVNKLGSH